MAATSGTRTPKPDHWERIVNSPFASAYKGELYSLARDTRETCERIFSSAPPPAGSPPASYIRVDHKLQGEIYRVLNNAARIRALIKMRERRKDQSARQFQVQEKRIKWMQSIIAGLPTDAILQAKVRNSLEHFDEYLDQTALRSSSAEIGYPTMFPIDMILGRRDTLSKEQAYLVRVYVAEERVFENCGKSIDLGKIAIECAGIETRLESAVQGLYYPGEDSASERGSTMIVITEDTFGSENPASDGEIIEEI